MITVVIADRMGKGQNVAKGVEAAGGKQCRTRNGGRYAFGRCDATRACRYGYLFLW